MKTQMVERTSLIEEERQADELPGMEEQRPAAFSIHHENNEDQ